MLLRNILIVSLLLLPAMAAANPDSPQRVNSVQVLPDSQALTDHLHALGYKVRGGIDRATIDNDTLLEHGFKHFSSSFSVQGQIFPFTMIGFPPSTGRAYSAKSVIIPLRMNFTGFGANGDVNISFDPAEAVANIIDSPLYVAAAFPNGFGQFGDQMQRAAFWNHMDQKHKWHVRMANAVVAPTIDIELTPAIGTLYLNDFGATFGDVPIDFMDAQIQAILQQLGVSADTVPIFVTNGVTAEALGYHNAYVVQDGNGQTHLQTLIFTSWFDPTLVAPIFADVSTLNHELLEWMNNPFINNRVPVWMYPPSTDPAATCSHNPRLEVGDPQGDGATYADFPAVTVPIGGTDYHLQQLVLWQWFTDESPSSAFDGWYTFPDPTSLKVPAVYCQ